MRVGSPGAVNIGDAGKVLRNANTEDYIPVGQIEKILGGAGIDPDKEIIVYARRGNPYAYFGLYTIQYFGGKQVADNAGMSLKSAEDLKKLYGGLDPGKETIVYCQSGVRAAETATVLAQLGFKDVKVYDSSWLGYAGVLSAPANNETFFNVGALNGRLSSMQTRIEQLERELAAAKASK